MAENIKPRLCVTMGQICQGQMSGTVGSFAYLTFQTNSVSLNSFPKGFISVLVHLWMFLDW